MTAFYIALSNLFELTAIALLIYGYMHEKKVIAWEQRVIRKAKKSLRNLLRKSKRIVAWAERPETVELNNSQVWSRWKI